MIGVMCWAVYQFLFLALIIPSHKVTMMQSTIPLLSPVFKILPLSVTDNLERRDKTFVPPLIIVSF